jgi:predicted transposase YbfD/YdcC
MNLQKHFAVVRDFRVKGRCLHELSDILLIVLLGTLADCSDFLEMEDYARDKEVFLREELGLLLLCGIPSEDTLRRAVRYLAPAELEKSLRSACREMLESVAHNHIRIDGKEMRGTIPFGKKHATIQVVSAWLAEESISFGQVQVDKKSNEITAIPRLLDQLDCEGSIITIDAMGCQKAIVEKIVEKKADYVIALKENQGELFQQVKDYLKKNKPHLPCCQQLNKDHNRGEKRVVYVAKKGHYVDAADAWKNLNSFVLVESTRIVNNKETTCQRIYISSLTDEYPEKYARLIRGHWAIENGLHWHLDLTFGEDDSRVRKDNGPLNLNIFRKFSLFLLTHEPSKISLKRKRKKAARDDDFMMQLLKSA